MKIGFILLAQVMSFWAGVEQANWHFLLASLLLGISGYVEDRRYRLS
ncbi:MAG: hypothetical protein KC422_08270 [Trueperaceae bacterium]|nr:hypothetical protein [Trueperaceae bacterium]